MRTASDLITHLFKSNCESLKIFGFSPAVLCGDPFP